MYVIGLTGSIASGKSSVSKILKQQGIPVIDADQMAREIVEPGKPAYQDIVNEFGAQVVDADGQLNRKRLGDIIFSDPEMRNKLNSFTHPRLKEVFERRMQQLSPDDRIVVWDVPLLLETNMDKEVNEVWVVWVDNRLQVERLMQRDGLTQTEAELRIASQMPMVEKMKRADRLIDNRGTMEETEAIVTKYYKQVSSILKADKDNKI
ncbi:MAG: dephospho-CoA kinase [Syntrophomonadaceae bacterium]|nr:dephospho-CoA kinase [Syntrophomonadaceae bacterium]